MAIDLSKVLSTLLHLAESQTKTVRQSKRSRITLSCIKNTDLKGNFSPLL